MLLIIAQPLLAKKIKPFLTQLFCFNNLRIKFIQLVLIWSPKDEFKMPEGGKAIILAKVRKMMTKCDNEAIKLSLVMATE